MTEPTFSTVPQPLVAPPDFKPSTDDSMSLKPIPEGFIVDVDHWKMTQHFEWDDMITHTDIPANRRRVAELLASAIVEFPYQGLSSRNPDTYLNDLVPKQWLMCCKAVGYACYNAFLV